MTSFVNDLGQYLDYSGEDVGITKQSTNLLEFKIKGDVSIGFKLRNSSPNRKALGYYGASQNSSPAFSKTRFSMVKDGNIISRGFIVIQGSDKDEINVFYVSGNSNWFQDFQFNLKDIVYDDTLTVLSADVDGRKAATEGIIFPLIDWWAGGARRATDYLSINRSPAPDEFPVCTDVHPCLYLHTIVRYMSQYAGVKVTGTLFEDGVKVSGELLTENIFKKIILTPPGPEYYVPDSIIVRSYALLQNGPFGSAGAGLYDFTLDPQLVRLNTIIEGAGQIDASTYAFYAPYTGTYRVDADFWFNVLDQYAVEIFINGALYSVLFNQSLTDRNKKGTAFVNMRKGDRMQMYVSNTLAANYRLDFLTNSKYTNVSIKLERMGAVSPTNNLGSGGGAEDSSWVIPNAITPDMKAIDLIKFLASFFCCAVTYDENANTISLDPIANLKKEDAEDWSDYVVEVKTRWDTKVARKNYIQTEDGPEEQIVSFNSQSNVTYGGGTIETPFDSMEEKELFRIPFSPSWDQKNITFGAFWPFVKFYDLEMVESTTYSGVANNGSGFSGFTCTFNDPIEDGDVFYVISNSGFYSGYAPFLASSTPTTNPVLYITFVASDTGTIIKYKPSMVDGPQRMLICEPGRPLTDVGGGTSIGVWLGGTVNISNPTTGAVAWFDKPSTLTPIDQFNDSLAVDSQNTRSLTISERYYGRLKKILSNPKLEVTFKLPQKVFTEFNFGLVSLKTKEVTGYFYVQKIENYKDAFTPVKCELLYID